MGSSNRRLNHETHSSVASSTASLDFHAATVNDSRLIEARLIEAVDGLGERVVVAVALAAVLPHPIAQHIPEPRENLLDFFIMAPSSQRREPPKNLGRFT